MLIIAMCQSIIVLITKKALIQTISVKTWAYFYHSYATKGLNSGLALAFVKAQMRHGNISTTSTYLHFTEESKDKLKDIF